MRENKYRGKRLDNGEWVYGYLVGGMNDSINQQQMYITSAVVYRAIEVDPETVGQYTGLHDATKWEQEQWLSQTYIKDGEIFHHTKDDWPGKEMYEGDIVKHKQYVEYGKLSEHIGVVSISPRDGVMVGHDSIGKDVEKIGNIHDNPELNIKK